MPSDPPPLQVLIVDDEPLIRRLLSGIIRKLGASPHSASNGDEALAMFQQICPPIDVALIDLTLSSHDCGGRLAIDLKKIRVDLPIILMSGYDLEEIDAFPVDAFLRKPFDRAQLHQTLRDLTLLA